MYGDEVVIQHEFWTAKADVATKVRPTLLAPQLSQLPTGERMVGSPAGGGDGGAGEPASAAPTAASGGVPGRWLAAATSC